MRKIGLLILAVLLMLLSACSASPPVGTPSANPVASSPQTPAATAIISGNVLLPKGLLPQTSYEPVSQPARYYADTTKTLIPSDDYGHIWPYVGGYLKVNFEGDWTHQNLYGLCDDKGRVICDPTYNLAEVIEKDGAKLYKLSIYHPGEPKKRNAKITLAKPDGTWVGEYDDIATDIDPSDYSSIFREIGFNGYMNWRPMKLNEYISVKKGDKWGAIDYSGNEILPCVYNAPLYFSEGLAATISDNGKEIRFIDSTGKILLGPYQTPPRQLNPILDWEEPLTYGIVFNEGTARFFKDGKFGIIDKNGNVIIEAKYDYISSFSGGTAKVISGKKASIIGANGKVLLEPTDMSFEKRSDGTIVLYEKDGQKSLDLSTGERKPWSYESTQSYKETYGDNPGATLKLKNGEQRFYPSSHITKLKSENYLIYGNKNNYKWQIINPDGNTVAGPFDGQARYDYTNHVIDVHKSEPNEEETDNDWYELYGENGNRLIPGYYLSITPFEGRYLVRDDTAAGLLDESGHWVIKVPLLEYMGD